MSFADLLNKPLPSALKRQEEEILTEGCKTQTEGACGSKTEACGTRTEGCKTRTEGACGARTEACGSRTEACGSRTEGCGSTMEEVPDVLDDAQTLANDVSDDLSDDDIESLLNDIGYDDEDDKDEEDEEDDDDEDDEDEEDEEDDEAKLAEIAGASSVDDMIGDGGEAELDEDEAKDADTYMAAVATPVILDQELSGDEKKDFLESLEADIVVNEGFLMESDLEELAADLGIDGMDDGIFTEAKIATKNKVQFTLKAWKARLFEIGVMASARSHNDPDFRRLQKIYKAKRKLRAKLREKYRTEANKRMKIYLKRLMASRSKTLNNIGKKLSK